MSAKGTVANIVIKILLSIALRLFKLMINKM